jgi:hypothetical protein
MPGGAVEALVCVGFFVPWVPETKGRALADSRYNRCRRSGEAALLSDPNAGIIKILDRTLPWVRLLSVAGFMSVGLVALLGAISWVGISTERVEQIPLRALIMYPILMVLAFVPAFYLHKCARRIRSFVAQGHMVQLEGVLEAQRAFWKFMGGLVLAMGMLLLAVLVIRVLAAL